MMQVFEEVREVVAETIGIEKWQVTMDSEIADDLGVDELSLIEIIMEMEDEHEISLEDTELDKIKTIECLVSKIQEKIEKKCKSDLT